MMKEKNATNTIYSYDELVKQVRHTIRGNIVSLTNFEYLQELNLGNLLVDAGLCRAVKGDSPLILTCPLLLVNVKCKAISVTSIS